jgi:hypothetical protein
MGYGEYLEWLSSSGFDTGYAETGVSPFKDHRETDPEEDNCDVEEAESDE